MVQPEWNLELSTALSANSTPLSHLPPLSATYRRMINAPCQGLSSAFVCRSPALPSCFAYHRYLVWPLASSSRFCFRS